MSAPDNQVSNIPFAPIRRGFQTLHYPARLTTERLRVRGLHRTDPKGDSAIYGLSPDTCPAAHRIGLSPDACIRNRSDKTCSVVPDRVIHSADTGVLANACLCLLTDRRNHRSKSVISGGAQMLGQTNLTNKGRRCFGDIGNRLIVIDSHNQCYQP